MQTPRPVLDKIAENRLSKSPALDLSDLHLLEIPLEELLELKHLRKLHLKDNAIQVVPHQLVQLPQLQLIDLRMNPLREIADISGLMLDWGDWWRLRSKLNPENIVGLWVRWLEGAEWIKPILELPQLTHLDLSGQHLKTIPYDIFQLSNLVELDLGRNALNILPDVFEKLQNLTALNLVDNNLSKLSDSFSALQHLIELNLAGNNLEELPSGLTMLRNLTVLNLASNNLADLPVVISTLSNLSELNLAQNNFNEELFIKLPNLTKLNLAGNNLNSLPASITNLTNLHSLNIEKNGLSELPDSIANLANLVVLSAGNNRLNSLPRTISQLEKLTELNLQQNHFYEIPSNLMHLSKLNVLNLTNNHLKHLPDNFANLKTLKELILEKNDFFELPNVITKLPNLIILNLADNYLAKLPDTINKLQKLENLNLAKNQLHELPDSIAKLAKLAVLNIGSNRLLNGLPRIITQLKNLTELNLERNNLKELPNAIVELKNLSALNLAVNQLEELPVYINQLKNLLIVNIAGNDLNKLPEAIVELANLIQLDLSMNNFRRLPDSLGHLPSLIILNLEQNKLGDIPNSIIELPLNLTKLNLAANDLTVLSDAVVATPNLLELNLNNNELSVMPLELEELRNLRALRINNRNLEQPPIELLELNREKYANITSLWGYYRQRREATVDKIYEAKLIIVGEAKAGKTTLARKIQNPEAEMPKEEESTEGIDIHCWEFPLHDKERNFRLNIWDFAGQEIYHATHQFFLTKRSLYALVADMRSNDTDFYWWLSIVKLLSDNSPIFIVKNEKDDRVAQIDEGPLRGRFKNLEKCFRSNLKTKDKLEDVLAFIRYRAPQLPHIGQELPKTWIDVRKALEEDTRDYINEKRYSDICEENGFHRSSDRLQLSQYLHDLGVFLHFQDDNLLRKTIILKPEWATNAVYKVVSDKTVQNQYGYFSRKDVERIWNEPRYDDMHSELLQLMERFHLCYELTRSEEYIIPRLLKVERPKHFHWGYKNDFMLRYEYTFMPKGILERLIVRLHKKIENNRQSVWKKGVIFNHNNHTRAFILEEIENRELTIRVSGRNREGFAEEIMGHLQEIHSSLNKIDYKILVPCQCEKFEHDPKFFEYTELSGCATHNQGIKCYKPDCYKTIDARALLEGTFKVIEKNQFDSEEEVKQGQVKHSAHEKYILILLAIIVFHLIPNDDLNTIASVFTIGLLVIFIFLLFIVMMVAYLRQYKKLSEQSFLDILKSVLQKTPSIKEMARIIKSLFEDRN